MVGDLERMRAVARVSVAPWAAGVTVAGLRVVVRVDGASTERDLEGTLRHEAVHLVWARHAARRTRRLPLWFEEGLAEEVGGVVSVVTGARLDVAAGTGALLDFTTLERAWPAHSTEAGLAYLQSRSWVQHLLARVGWERVRSVLARLVADAAADADLGLNAFDRALLQATDHAASDWHADWRTALQQRSSDWWLWFLEDLDGALWALVALVCGLTYFALRRRRRREIEALPDEPGPRESRGDAPP